MFKKGVGLNLELLADFLNERSHNRCPVCGVIKLQPHAATDEASLEHGTAPSRACDGHQNGLRTVLRMSGNQGRTTTQNLSCVEMVLGPDQQHCGRRQVFEGDASLDFGTDDMPIDFVAEVRMRSKQDAPSLSLRPGHN
jgi:hypothetical protein